MKHDTQYALFVSCAKGLEYLLEDELKTLGLHITRVNPQGVYGEGPLDTAYTICLWSRLASRVQVILFSGEASKESLIYDVCHKFSWQTVFTADKTFAVEFHGSSMHIRNTMYGAQVVKDAIVDHFRQLGSVRPMVDRETPHIRLHAYLKHDVLTVSLDLTGYSLHQRGYRLEAGVAPLKETIAAAMLIRAKWPERYAEGFHFHDPFCGAGTVVIEAAMMAARLAPGLIRDDQSLHHWAAHQPSLWESLRQAALLQVRAMPVPLRGTDVNPRLIEAAKANAARAGVVPWVEFEVLPLNQCKARSSTGLLICNPPYGERLSEATHLIPLYQELGSVLHAHYTGWEAALLTSNVMLAKATGLRAGKQYTLYNGALECKLYCLSLTNNQLKGAASDTFSEGASMFANRLKKNFMHLQKWANRNQISCYRVYDADLPEYAYAIDIYNDYVVLQEYAAPSTIEPYKVEKRSLDVLQVVPRILAIPPEHLIVKQRKQQKGTNQYQKMDETRRMMVVQEGQAKLKVNLYDYLDTGLFLDHRALRLRFATLPKGTRLLNCFCYTATASVHAAKAGAITTNVDLSNTYLRWAEENFKLNHVALSAHQFIQYDCIEWLKVTRDRFDVIFLDPPSFSNSKRMSTTLDIQRDHEALIASAMRLLMAKGVLYFSTNFRQFKLSPQIHANFKVRDISAETIDLDFKRNQRIHQCFEIRSPYD